MQEILLALTGAGAIAGVNWYFFGGRKGSIPAASLSGGKQEITIAVEGGYTPSVIRAKKGQPLRLIFDRKEKSPCSDEVVLSAFRVRRFLKPFEKTVVDLTPDTAGTFEFACGMNMLRGQIEVEA